jgi:hypothetical protein
LPDRAVNLKIHTNLTPGGFKLTNNKPELPTTVKPLEVDSTNQETARKLFVEPEISSPVDVLEATTYFQGVDSGATN